MVNRETLQGYFKKNDTPSEDNFRDLINSFLNVDDDKIKRLNQGPVAIEAQSEKGGVREVLHFYKNLDQTTPVVGWRMNLNTTDAMAGLDIADKDGISRLFIKEAGGNVGIGTNNPQNKLQVSGGNLMVDGKIGVGVSPNFPLSFPNTVGQKVSLWGQDAAAACYGLGIADGALLIHADVPSSDILLGYGSATKFTERMRVKGDGTVGIGTSTPRARLEVAGGAIMPSVGKDKSAGIFFPENPGGNSGDAAWIRYYVGSGQESTVFEMGTSNDPDDHIALMPTGNVGIGTRAPGEKLHISGGNLYIETGKIMLGAGRNNGFAQMANTNKNTIGSDGNGGNQSSFAWAGNQSGYIGQFYNEGALATSHGVIVKVAAEAATALDISQGGQEVVRPSIFCVKGTGKVGIGTNDPGEKLHVKNGNLMVDGKIGVGVSPNFPLSFPDTLGQKVSLWGQGAACYGFGIAGASLIIHTNLPESDILLGYGSGVGGAGFTERMRVKGDGNVGIGTRAPQGKLHVDGAIFATGPRPGGQPDLKCVVLSLENGGGKLQTYGNMPLFINPDGNNVGIGTINPQAKLEVKGSNSLTYNNYAFLANTDDPKKITGKSNDTFNTSILASDRIVATEFDAVSDRRIKKNIVNNEPQNALQILNNIRIKDYLYKDEIQYDSSIKKGVIAQEVESVFPEAVSKHTDFVPDIYSLPESAMLSNDLLTVAMPQPHGLQTGNLVRLITGTGSKEVKVTVTSENTFAVSNWNEPAIDIFVYGKQVDDFRTVNYNSIFCLGISAIQALHKQVQQLQEEMKGLKERLSAAFVPAF